MFRKARIGDKVWDYTKGWGIISNDCLIQNNRDFPVIVEFKNSTKESYSFDGKKHYEDLNPSLFWDEIKFEVPEKPFNLENELKQLEIKEFVSNEDNFYLEWDNNANKIRYGQRCYCQQPFDIYFEKESVKRFMNNVKDKNITKEQFFAAYKNVFEAK